jgi:CRISPR/Cas system-associated exonuclease Cas4 (RecB family)
MLETYLKKKVMKTYIVSLDDYSFHRVDYDYKANKYVNSLILEAYQSLKTNKLCARSKNVNKCKNCSFKRACNQFD